MKRFAILFACAAMVSAHEGPEHEIEELTERINKHGETAALLTERAVEYRVMGKLAEATKDLERAVALAPGSLAAHRELARVLFLGGKTSEALDSIVRALKLPGEEPADTASLRMLRAEIFRAQKENKKAVEECDAGLKLYKKNPEWYLLRSDIQSRLKMHKERVVGLEEGIKETGAGVLEIERVEAMIDAGQCVVALKIIEAELADSRIKSSWLIRRAHALLALGRKAEAEADLKAALKEIAQRMNPRTPDVPLLLDIALAQELLGERKDALRSYEDAREKGASDSINEKIKALLEVVGSPEKRDVPEKK